mmetsp:Transcript_12031/g.43938  ORF Transcript_12031/g.43938 Transcript_12031/m.43938 type:complete len:279 (+) Transcript_12031:123-959(+)
MMSHWATVVVSAVAGGTAAAVAGYVLFKHAAQGSPQRVDQVTMNKSLARALYAEVWNCPVTVSEEELLAICGKYVSDKHVLVDPSNPNPEGGVAGYCLAVKAFNNAFPQAIVSVDDAIGEGSKVALQLTFKTMLQDRTVMWTATATVQFENFRATRTWVNSDALSALIQLGLLPDVVTGNYPEPFRRKVNNLTTPSEQQKRKEEMVAVLAGRNTTHPEVVLTAQDWLDYYNRVAKNNDMDPDASTWQVGDGAQGNPHVKKSLSGVFRTDAQTGLDIVA